ncbi:unnamed protein product, partial [Heterosigma akashiwo]
MEKWTWQRPSRNNILSAITAQRKNQPPRISLPRTKKPSVKNAAAEGAKQGSNLCLSGYCKCSPLLQYTWPPSSTSYPSGSLCTALQHCQSQIDERNQCPSSEQ